MTQIWIWQHSRWPGLTLEAAGILAEDGLITNAIEGEKFDPAHNRFVM